MSEKIKKLVLDKRKEGKIVHTTIEGMVSIGIKDFLKQPIDGVLYDLNRLEEVSLTFIDDPKWINDFAVALTIRELYAQNTKLREALGWVKSPCRADENTIVTHCNGCEALHNLEKSCKKVLED